MRRISSSRHRTWTLTLFVGPLGFAGHELPADHSIDIYTPATDTWIRAVPALADPTRPGPGARSVHGFVPFRSPAQPSPASTASTSAGPIPVALVFHGERDPSSKGHEGVGSFWDDLWVLEHKADIDGWEFIWREVHVEKDAASPEGRGWFPGVGFVDEEGKSRAVVFGGLLGSGDRSGETWVLEVL
jgi:hypothetical protein